MIERTKQLIVDRLGVNRVAAHADRLEAEIDALRMARDQILHEIAHLRASLHELELDHEHATAWTRIRIASEWAATVPLLHTPTISIVLPTHNRSGMLRTAIDSVRNQSYPNWQLVIIDDGSTDDTPALLTELDDERITTTRTTGVGASSARNHGLQLTTGDYITFLDDDNLMAPGWLRAVAEYTGRHPDCDVLYGAQIRDREPDEHHLHGRREVNGLHLLYVDPFDPERLRNLNYVDLGTLVARRGHPELHFDEQLELLEDWELVIRLTRDTAAHPLPVLASLYRTTAPHRVSSSERRHPETEEMRKRFSKAVSSRGE